MMSTTSLLLLLVAVYSTTTLAQSTAGPSIPTLDTCTNGQIWVQNYIQFQCQVSGTNRAVVPIACVPSNTASGTTIAPGTTYDDTNFRYTCNQTSANTMAYYIVACFDGDHRLLQVGQSSNSSDGYTYKCYLSSNQVQLSKTLLPSGTCTLPSGQKIDIYTNTTIPYTDSATLSNGTLMTIGKGAGYVCTVANNKATLYGAYCILYTGAFISPGNVVTVNNSTFLKCVQASNGSVHMQLLDSNPFDCQVYDPSTNITFTVKNGGTFSLGNGTSLWKCSSGGSYKQYCIVGNDTIPYSQYKKINGTWYYCGSGNGYTTLTGFNGCTSSTGQKYDLQQTWIQDGIYQMSCSATNGNGVYTGTAVQIACVYPPTANQTVPLNGIAVIQTVPLKCAYNGTMYVLRNLTAAELQQFNSTNSGGTQVIGGGGGSGSGSDQSIPQTTTTPIPTTTTTTTPPPPPPTTTTPARTAAPTTVTTTTAPPPPPTTTTVARTAAPTVATAAPTIAPAVPTTTTAAPTTTTTAVPTTTTTAAPATEQVTSSTPPPSTTTAIIIQPTTTTTQPLIPSTEPTTACTPAQSGNDNCTDSFLFCSQLAPVCLGRSFKIFENVRQLLRSGNVSSQELVQAFDAAVQKSFSDEVSTTTTESSLAAGARLLVRAFAGSDSREEEGERGQVAGGCKCARRQGSACDCAPPAPPAPGCERCRRFKTRLLQLVRAFCPLTCHACDAGLGNALPDLVQQLVELYLTDCRSLNTAPVAPPPPPDANRLLL